MPTAEDRWKDVVRMDEVIDMVSPDFVVQNHLKRLKHEFMEEAKELQREEAKVRLLSVFSDHNKEIGSINE